MELSQDFRYQLSDAIALTVGWILVAALAVIVCQCLHYLFLGDWPEVSLLTLLRWFDTDGPLVASWPELYEILDFLPLSLTLIAQGIQWLFFRVWLDSRAF